MYSIEILAKASAGLPSSQVPMFILVRSQESPSLYANFSTPSNPAVSHSGRTLHP